MTPPSWMCHPVAKAVVGAHIKRVQSALWARADVIPFEIRNLRGETMGTNRPNATNLAAALLAAVTGLSSGIASALITVLLARHGG
jgi:hypothetical protein